MTNIFKIFAGDEHSGIDKDRKKDDEASNLMLVAVVHLPVAHVAVSFLALSSKHHNEMMSS